MANIFAYANSVKNRLQELSYAAKRCGLRAIAALHSLPIVPGSSLSGMADLQSRIAEVPGPDLAKSCVPVGR